MSRPYRCLIAWLLWLLASGYVGLLGAADFHVGPADYRDYLPRLKAGDRLLLRAGDYQRGLPLHHLQGEPDRPIVISGPQNGPPARFLARGGANTVSLINVSHIHIRNLELDGGNKPVDAIKAEGHAHFAHFVTLENLYIHDHAASQQNVGISTKCPAYGWIIRGNRIERVGTGMYFGNSDGRAPFIAGLIEANQISDTLGYNLQIKHQLPRLAGLPAAGVPHETVIRRNLFDKSSGGAQGPLARPNLLVGHWPTLGDGKHDRYLIYANLFWQNPTESLFQGEGNLALYNNIFVTSGASAVRIQPHNDVPREVRILFNSVVAAGQGISVIESEPNPYRQHVVGNVVFAAKPMQGGQRQHNFTGSYPSAGRHLRRPHAELAQLDLTPLVSLTASQPLDSAWLRDLPEIERDFAGQVRPPLAIGARVGSATASPVSASPSQP